MPAPQGATRAGAASAEGARPPAGAPPWHPGLGVLPAAGTAALRLPQVHQRRPAGRLHPPALPGRDRAASRAVREGAIGHGELAPEDHSGVGR